MAAPTDSSSSSSPSNCDPPVDSYVTMTIAARTTTTTLTTTPTSLVFDPKSSSIETRLVATSVCDPRNDAEFENKRLASSGKSVCRGGKEVENNIGNIIENPRNKEPEEEEDEEDEKEDETADEKEDEKADEKEDEEADDGAREDEWRRQTESERFGNLKDGQLLDFEDGNEDDAPKRKPSISPWRLFWRTEPKTVNRLFFSFSVSIFFSINITH